MVVSGAFAVSAYAGRRAGFYSTLTGGLRVPALAFEHGRHRAAVARAGRVRGLFEIVLSTPGAGLSTGLTTLLGAAGVGMGLAAGVSMGTYLARPRRVGLDRGRRHALRRSVGEVRPVPGRDAGPASPRG